MSDATISDQPKGDLSNQPATGSVDIQDPLPEQDWTWRRAYTYALTLVACVGVGFALDAIRATGDIEALYGVARWMLAMIAMLATYYMVAPSAEQIVKLIQAAKLLKAGVPMTRSAVVETPQGGRAEVTTTAGTPDTSAAPNRAPEPPAGGVDALPEDADWK